MFGSGILASPVSGGPHPLGLDLRALASHETLGLELNVGLSSPMY